MATLVNHPQRFALNDALHACPLEPIEIPEQASYRQCGSADPFAAPPFP